MTKHSCRFALRGTLIMLALAVILLSSVGTPTTNAAAIAAPPAAQPVVAFPGTVTSTVYLPFIFKQAGPSAPPGPPPASTSPSAAALSQTLAKCAGTTLNQVCYASGSVTLTGGGPLTTPGQVATLEGVSGLKLVSPDAGHWSVALLRLAADASTPNLGLTLLAFGNVEIRNLTLFRAAAATGDVAPALSFSSSPVPGQDPETGGLIVYNPTHEDPLSIDLNGANLTLASSAVVQAQPGAKMTVTMATGSALVSTTAGGGALVQAEQLTVPLDGNGTATGAPTTPTVTGDDLLEPLESDLLVDLVPKPKTRREIYNGLFADFGSAYDRCMKGDSHQVYRVMWYARVLKKFEAEFPSGVPEWPDNMVRPCATFELEFNSVVTPTTMIATGSTYVKGQGLIVSYGVDGKLVQPGGMPLTHVTYDIDFPPFAGCYYIILADGRLSVSDSYMRINRNGLDISTAVGVAGVWEHFMVTCPETVEMANPELWDTMIRKLHKSERTLTGFLFTPEHWKYTGNQILAEAIFERQVTDPEGVIAGDTWLVMLHRPGGK